MGEREGGLEVPCSKRGRDKRETEGERKGQGREGWMEAVKCVSATSTGISWNKSLKAEVSLVFVRW